MPRVYLDYNATTPLSTRVRDAISTVMREDLGNPSSHHWAGVPAHTAVERARQQVADLLGCSAREVIFTSGGTEANNAAIKGIFFLARRRITSPHFIISSIEHPAIAEPCRFVESLGARVTRLPVDREGLVAPEAVERALDQDTVLVSIMLANNEVGTLQPIEAISRITRERGVPLHTDAAQAVGKIPVDVDTLGVDLLSVAGHKLYAPQGIGVLYVRDGIRLDPFLHGAGHEQGRRAGTENILEIVGLGAACEEAKEWNGDQSISALRDRLWEALRDRFGDRVTLNGHTIERLPNTLNVSFVGKLGYEILAGIPDLAASTGSACHAGSTKISPVLAAMQVPMEVAAGAVRFSLGRATTREEIDAVVEMLEIHFRKELS